MFHEIKASNLFRYACLAFPLAFAGLPIYMLAPDFYSVHLQLSLSTIGVGLLILRMLDAFLDPLIGRIIDLFMYKAKLIGAISCCVLCLGFFMLFVPPAIKGMNAATWFFISIFLVTTAFSALTILYGAIGAIWSNERPVQTLITSYREAATLVGLILSISFPFILLEFMIARRAYLALVVVFIGLLILFYRRYQPVQIAILGALRGTESSVGNGTETSPKASILLLYFTYALSAFASAVPAVLVVFFIRDYLGNQGFVGIALVLYFLSGALSMPFWHRLARRYGKLRAWQLSMALAILSFTWVCLLSPGDYLFYAVICLMSGAALGAEMALPPAILSEYVSDKTNQSAAQKYSGLTMISKLSLALSAGVCLPLLGVFGFEPGAQNGAEPLFILVILYGALPGVLKLLALLAMQLWIRKEKESSNYADIKSFSNTRSMPDV